MKQTNLSRRGFTLLEVMIAIILLAIGMMASAGLQVLGVRGNVNGEDRGVAASLMMGKLHELVSLQYTRNPQTGVVTMADPLNTGHKDTCVWTQPVSVNRFGYSADQLAAMPSHPTNLTTEAFPYRVRYCVYDHNDAARVEGYKRISVSVAWDDRLTNITGEENSVQLLDFPLMPRFMD